MFKRFFFFLLILTILAVPALACIHTDSGEVVDEDLLEANLIPAQPGVAGSVDIICPLCREVVEHVILAPLPAEAEHPASSDAETPPDPAPAVQQETVQEQTPQESSTQPEQPVQPAQPAQPTQPEAPAQPATPAEPARLEEPISQSGGSAAVPAADTGSSAPAAAAAAEPPKAQEVTANVPPETTATAGTGGTATGTGSSGGGAARQGGRAKISGGGEEATVPAEKPQTVPCRRIKMKPKPGIRAEAAGELLWPVFGTPFQNIDTD